ETAYPAPLCCPVVTYRSRNGLDLHLGVIGRHRFQQRLSGVVHAGGGGEEAGLLQLHEREGVSVFYKDPAGRVFHTYSAYARGIDLLNAEYNYLDQVPKGRDEGGRGPTGCAGTTSTIARRRRLALLLRLPPCLRRGPSRAG